MILGKNRSLGTIGATGVESRGVGNPRGPRNHLFGRSTQTVLLTLKRAPNPTQNPCSPATATSYLIELAAAEKTLLALEPIRRSVPTTITKTTASMSAYSATSWPFSSIQDLRSRAIIFHLPTYLSSAKKDEEDLRVGGSENGASIGTKWLALTPKVHQILCFWWRLVKQGRRKNRTATVRLSQFDKLTPGGGRPGKGK